uniref:TIGR02679 family protein n=1 Tax=Agathobacter sp. TaxID=2021311 RepID=UPI004055F700
MCSNKQCANYLKRNAAYKRCLAELRKKWESYGKVAGTITLKEVSEEERRAISSIVGKMFLGKDIKFTFAEFEQGLQKTRFAPIDMKKVLDAYFGEEILTNREKRSLMKNDKELFLCNICAKFEDKAAKADFGCCHKTSDTLLQEQDAIVVLWLRALIRDKKYGYQLLIKEYANDPDKAAVLAENVGNAIFQLENMAGEAEYPLAIFAAQISGNPHFFDRGSVAAQLLMHAIAFWKNCNIPITAYEWRELLQSVGIISDNIASIVHALGVHMETPRGPHPAYEAFCKRKEPFVITSENLKHATGAKAMDNRVYIVENEMVFLHLAENGKEKDITLLCTSGQLRVAAFQLITLFIENGAMIYYSGDLDPEGMHIANRLWQTYGDAVQMWRMSPEDYQVSMSQEVLSEMRLAKLGHISHPTLRQTAECMMDKKRAAYQENLLGRLLGDLFQTV